MSGSVGEGGWKSWPVRGYYILGATYYLYQWLIYAGGIGIATAAVAGFFSSYDYLAMAFGGLSAIAFVIGIVLLIATFRKRYKGSNPGLKLLSLNVVYRILPNNQFEYLRSVEASVGFPGVNS